MTVRELLERKGSKVIMMQQNSTVREAVQTMVDGKVGSVVIIDAQGQPVGIFTERDLLNHFNEGREGIREKQVSALMTSDLIISTPDKDIEEVMNIMTEKHLRHLPILDDNRVVGMVSIGDIVKANLKRTRFEIQYLRDYISGRF